MAGVIDEFRAGRNEARARRGASSRSRPGTPESPLSPTETGIVGGASVADLEAALRSHEDELAESKRLLGEMTDYAEMMQSRVIELIAAGEVMAKALRLPGVKTFLVQRFHPDKYPDADAEKRELLTRAFQTITAAYARAGELQSAEDSSSPSESGRDGMGTGDRAPFGDTSI
jgi:hypothetical protein